MKKDLIDQRHVRRMEDLLQEPKIAEAVLMDIENLETYQVSDVNGDGTITLGKRKVRWWNRLFGLERTISFKDFAFNTLRALVGMAENLNKNTILQGLSRELIAKAVLDHKYEFVIDRLFDVARFAVESGELNTVATPANGKVMPEPDVQVVNRDVRVVLENKGYIPIRDSLGNVLLNLRVKVDGYTFDNV